MSTRDFFSMRGAHVAAAALACLVAGCPSADNTTGPPPSGEADGSSDAGQAEIAQDACTGSPMDGNVVGQDSGGGQVDATLSQDAGIDSDASSTGGRTDSDVVDAGGAPDSSSPLDARVVTPAPMPSPLLSATGLFKSIGANGTLVLGDGVQEYQPKYTLWSDGDQKNRWVLLPPGSKIDTTDLDHWFVPVGTKFWKEFAVGGKRVETRLVWRYGPGPDDFLYVTYWWNPEAGIPNDAELTDPDNGAQAVNGTTHDIPTQQNCVTCHGSIEEHVLGFGAIELNHTLPGANIHTLIEAGALTQNPNLADLAIPGDPTAQAALGYLHANCGNCHNNTPGATGVPDPRMNLRVLVGTKTVQATDTYTTAVNVLTTDFTLIKYRIAGQDPTNSCVTHDMVTRGAREQMPPLASKIVDDAGVATVNAWIMTLPKAP